MVQPYSTTDTTNIWKNSRFISSEINNIHGENSSSKEFGHYNPNFSLKSFTKDIQLEDFQTFLFFLIIQLLVVINYGANLDL